MKKTALQLAKQLVNDSKENIEGNIADYMIMEVGETQESFFEYLTEAEITEAESDSNAWNKLSFEVTDMLRANFDYDITKFEY